MLDPSQLYAVDPDAPSPGDLAAPVLVHALSGFVDAGGATDLAVKHLLGTLDHRRVVTFDADALHDYRARRPATIFDQNRYTSFDAPVLALDELRDPAGTPFLLLTGPEPDTQWERFVAAVIDLVRRFGVRLTVGLGAFPFPAPHTRAMTVTASATDEELLAGRPSYVGTLQVPGSAGALLQLRLGESGLPAMGFAAHVPHYLAQFPYPPAAIVLLEQVAAQCGLTLPTGDLDEAARAAIAEVDEQIAANEESRSVVRALEEQYDAFARGTSAGSLLAPSPGPLPSADEIGAEFEKFLAEQDRRRFGES